MKQKLKIWDFKNAALTHLQNQILAKQKDSVTISKNDNSITICQWKIEPVLNIYKGIQIKPKHVFACAYTLGLSVDWRLNFIYTFFKIILELEVFLASNLVHFFFGNYCFSILPKILLK